MKTTTLFALLGLFAVSAGAAVTTTNSVTLLERKADAIVVGSAHGAFQPGSVPNLTNFTLTVVRVIRGNLSPGDVTITFRGAINPFPHPPLLAGPVEARGDGLWFLKQVPGGWEVLPATSGGGFGMSYYPASLAAPTIHPYPPNASTDDKLASELGEQYEKSSGFGLYMLNKSGLASIKSPVVPQVMNDMASSPDIDKQLIALTAKVRQGDIGGLGSAIALSPAWVGSQSLQMSDLLLSIREQWRSTDPVAIGLLGRAATDTTNSNTSFRLVAAHAVASIHSKESLPYLATLLDDANGELRAEGVGGLASFALGLPVQSMAGIPNGKNYTMSDTPWKNADTIRHFGKGYQTISRNESYYLTFWKTWWQQNKAGIGY